MSLTDSYCTDSTVSYCICLSKLEDISLLQNLSMSWKLRIRNDKYFRSLVFKLRKMTKLLNFQNKDWIHIDTTPLYAMVRFSGAALGLVSDHLLLFITRVSINIDISFILSFNVTGPNNHEWYLPFMIIHNYSHFKTEIKLFHIIC